MFMFPLLPRGLTSAFKSNQVSTLIDYPDRPTRTHADNVNHRRSPLPSHRLPRIPGRRTRLTSDLCLHRRRIHIGLE